MNVYLRKKRRSSSGTLFVTFLLGAAIGFSVAYAIFANKPAPSPPRPVAPVPEPEAPEPPAEPAPQPPAPVPEDTSAQAEPEPVEEPAPAEKFWPGRLLVIAAPDVIDNAAAEFLAEIRPGGVLLRETQISEDPEQTRRFVSQIKQAAGFGRALADLPLIAVEQEGGQMNPLRLDPAPSAPELASTADTEAALELGRAAAKAAIDRGISVVLAPMLAVLPQGVKNDAMAGRVFGADQELVANMGLAYADGLSLGGVISVAKYYPGVGIARRVGTNLQLLDAESPKLAELMYPFWEAATANLPGMLAGHVAVPSLDLYDSERPASMSPVLIRNILRDDWRYGGVILADNVCSEELASTVSPPKAAVGALRAGCDAVLVLDKNPDAVREVCEGLRQAIETGVLSQDALEESCKRLDAWQAQLAGYSVPADQPPVELPGEQDVTPEPPADKPEEAQAPGEPVAPVEPVTPPQPEQRQPQPPAAETEPLEPEPSEPVESEPVEPESPEVEAPPPSEQPEPIEVVAPPQPPESLPEETQPAPDRETSPEPAAGEETIEIVHHIKKGEMLSGIAVYYGVKQDDIVKWNNLKSKNIKYGFDLKIYRPASAPPLPPPPTQSDSQTEQAPPSEPPPDQTEDTAENPAPESDSGQEASVLLANRKKYVVKAGDTLKTIGRKLEIDPKIIRAWNGLESDDVSEGQVLVIFASGADAAPAAKGENGFYVVKEGDNAYRIAEAFGTDLKTLLEMNKDIKNPNLIIVGQRLAVPKKP